MRLTTVTLLILLATVAAQKDPNFADGRTTIVHLFEWKWDDIAEECENFLQHKGFGGVQISPPGENQVITSPNRPWWERYQPVSYLLVTRSGDEAALASMIKRCNAVGVRIYVDGVINHMAAMPGIGTGGSVNDPGNKHFPAVPFESEHFHPSCPIDTWDDILVVRNCELNALPDLDQSLDHVRQKQVEYMDHLIDLGVAGFRIDAAKLMWPADLEAIFGSLKNLNEEHGFKPNSRPFIYQEVVDFGNEPIKQDEYVGFGAILEFKYGSELGNAFQGNNPLHVLVNWGEDWGFANRGDAVVFIDNHDNQRAGSDSILTYKKSKPYKAAIAFMLAHPYGTTRIMSSYYFDDNDVGPPQDASGNIVSPGFDENGVCTNGWVCEHRWREIYNMVVFKSVVEGSEITNWWSNGDQQIAFGRGDKGFIAFTIEGDIDEVLPTSLPSGTYCDVISGDLENGKCTGKTVVVDGAGAHVKLSTEDDYDAVIVIHVNAKL